MQCNVAPWMPWLVSMPFSSMNLLLPSSAILATLDPMPCSRMLELLRLQCTSCSADNKMRYFA